MAALPVVCKTNHGIATNARTFPVSETALDPSRARIGVRRFGPVVRESSTALHRTILWANGAYHLLDTGRRTDVDYADKIIESALAALLLLEARAPRR